MQWGEVTLRGGGATVLKETKDNTWGGKGQKRKKCRKMELKKNYKTNKGREDI